MCNYGMALLQGKKGSQTSKMVGVERNHSSEIGGRGEEKEKEGENRCKLIKLGFSVVS